MRFKNRCGIAVAAHLYVPKNARGKLPAQVVSGPFGAVEEQSSGFCADEFARRGYVTLAFGPSFTGGSGGNVREVASPDIFTEDYSAAVDFLGLRRPSTARGSARSSSPSTSSTSSSPRASPDQYHEGVSPASNAMGIDTKPTRVCCPCA